MMIHQLRIYEIFGHNKVAFRARFSDHAARMMKRDRFEVRCGSPASGSIACHRERGIHQLYMLRRSPECEGVHT